MLFVEAEGLTLIIEREVALAEDLAFEFECRMITLNVHSALEAVGFLARVIPALAGLGMGVNPVAGFYHDHCSFPPTGHRTRCAACRPKAARPPQRSPVRGAPTRLSCRSR